MRFDDATINKAINREAFERVVKRLAEYGVSIYAGWQFGLTASSDGSIRESCYGVANIPELAHRTERITPRKAVIAAVRRMRDVFNDAAEQADIDDNRERRDKLLARRDGLDAILREFDTLWPESE